MKRITKLLWLLALGFSASTIAQEHEGRNYTRVIKVRSLGRGFLGVELTPLTPELRADGPVDHWATLEETLSANGDDCDGLELLAFHALRDLGFGSHEVYRAIVVRPEDGQHHMVTLWFETPDDPWVIDPTGAMTLGMPRMTEMPAWVPLKVFTDTAEYTATPARDGHGFSSLAVNP